MSRSLALKLALVLLVASVAIKLTVDRTDDPRRPARLAELIDRFLVRQGYVVTHRPNSPEPVMVGTRENCRLIVAEMRAQGWNQSWLQSLSDGRRDMFFVYHGSIETAQPVRRTAFDYQLARILWQLGIPVAWRPVLGVLASPQCEARRLPWREVATIQ